MKCDNCHKEGMLDLIFVGDEAQYLCPRCKRMPLCPKCGKRKNRVVLVPMSKDKMCCACYRKIYQ